MTISSQQLASALFKLSTLREMGDIRPLLVRVKDSLPNGKGNGSQLKFSGQLLKHQESWSVAQALCEIACSSKALASLIQGNPQLAQTVVDTAGGYSPAPTQTTTELREQYKDLSVVNSPPSASKLARLWGGIRYWVTGVPAALGLGLPVAVEEMVRQAFQLYSTGQVNGHPLFLASLLVGAGAITFGPRYRRILDYAETDIPTFHAHIRAMVDSLQWPLDKGAENLLWNGDAVATTNVVESILQSRGPDAPPSLSALATLRCAFDFLHMATPTLMAMGREDSRKLYNNLSHLTGVGVLGRLQWRPIVLHPERLTEIKSLKDRGARVIFVSNHRSYLDILAAVALLRDFDVRIVAKAGLKFVPAVGWVPSLHPFKKGLLAGAEHILVDRGSGPEAGEQMTELVRDRLSRGYSIYIMAEGTRLHTRDRQREEGIQPFRKGIFHTIQALKAEGSEIVVVPLGFYGLGQMLPKNHLQAVTQGVRVRQPVVLSIGEPIIPSRETSLSALKELNKGVWGGLWGELSEIQNFMNGQENNVA